MNDIVERRMPGNIYKREGFDAAAAEITALREKLERAEQEREEAMALAFSEHENEIRAIDAAKAAESRANALQARVEKLEEALRAISNMPDIDGALDDSGYQRRAKHDLQSIARSALAADGENNAREHASASPVLQGGDKRANNA